MAKNTNDLARSREIRQAVIEKYGAVPISVIEPDYSWGKHVIEYDGRKQQAVAKKKHEKMNYGETHLSWDGTGKKGLSKEELSKTFGMSSQNVRGKSGGLSTFPPGLAKWIVQFYSEKGETVLDPCAGHNSRMQVTHGLERNYIGYDVSKEFMEFNRKVKDTILGNDAQGLLFQPSSATITLREQSSEKLEEKDNSIDMIYTSPPYWDIEFYGEEPEQLGYGKSYEQFLDGIFKILRECHRTLKTNHYCIFNINDFRKGGWYYAYHVDLLNQGRKAGFYIHDIVIVKWASAIGACFASQVEERKITAKSHEYLIVMRK